MKKIGIYLFFPLCFLCLSGCRPVGWPEARWSEALTTHTLLLTEASRLEFVWVQTVFTPKIGVRQLAATNSKVFFVGSLSHDDPRTLIALDGDSGIELWQIPDAATVDVSPEMVYVDDGTSVVAHTPTGEKLWRTRLPGARNVSYFHAVDGKLYVDAGGFHLLDALTGELLASSSQTDIFEADFNPGLFWYFSNTPAFVDRRIFVRDEESYSVFSAAVALDRDSGDMLWESVDNVISNVVATKSLVFVITLEDELKILDAYTGKLLEKIPIEPSINFFELAEETNVQHEGYFLAVDETNQLLYVLLGDSNQLFAFKIRR